VYDPEQCYRDEYLGYVCPSASQLLASDTLPWDKVGNPTDGTVQTGNRLTAYRGYNLVYDDAGNLTRKWKSGFDQYLYWDALGQLDSVKTNGSVVSFGYDGLGRRARKTTSSGTVRFMTSS
jgi:YD repeat-containing protein